MTGSQQHYQQLLVKYIDNRCTPAEVEEVMEFLQQDDGNRLLLQQLKEQFDVAMTANAVVPEAVSDGLRERLKERIQPAVVVPLYKRMFFRVAAAVLIIAGLGTAAYQLLNKPAPHPVIVKKAEQPAAPAVAGKARATITLANGQQILLDSTANGTLMQEGSTTVTRTEDGRLVYSAPLTIDDSRFTYNTLTVPRGGQFVPLTLTDGTKVWVNTASSLKYPIAFTGNERIVELTGEAYFEVAHDQRRPFRVRTNNMTVEVLGTEFNVSSYSDDEQQQVVLVNGSVALEVQGRSGKIHQALTPGKLAGFNAVTGKLAVTAVNTEEYVSWRKGYLIFKQTSLEQIIRRLGRYYDVQVNTDVLAAKKETFSGRLDLGKRIDDVMQVICTGSPFVYLPQENKLVLKE